jgi:hypothetical protein
MLCKVRPPIGVEGTSKLKRWSRSRVTGRFDSRNGGEGKDNFWKKRREEVLFSWH